MKRTELSPGQEVLWSRYNDWRDHKYGARKVIVLDTKPWVDLTSGSGYVPSSVYSRPAREVHLPTGEVVTVRGHLRPARDHEAGAKGVLVRYDNDNVEVVQLSQLRGPWAEAHAEMEAAQRRTAEYVAAARQREHARNQQEESAMDAANRFGLVSGLTRSYGKGTITVPASTLTAMIEALEALGVTADDIREGRVRNSA